MSTNYNVAPPLGRHSSAPVAYDHDDDELGSDAAAAVHYVLVYIHVHAGDSLFPSPPTPPIGVAVLSGTVISFEALVRYVFHFHYSAFYDLNSTKDAICICFRKSVKM